MNILYEGIYGSAANPQLGGPLLCIGIVVIIVGTILLALSGADENWLVLLIIPLACIIIGIFNLIDSRTPVVKATLDDTVSFTEIQNFKPHNINIDEWEQQVKEQNKEADE